MTISAQAANYFNSFIMENSSGASSAVPDISVDEAVVREDKYNITSLSNALDASNKAASINIYSISNVSNYAKNCIKVSQLSDYDSIGKSPDNRIIELLSNRTDLSDLYDSMSTLDYINTLTQSSFAKTSVSSVFNSYLNKLSDK